MPLHQAGEDYLKAILLLRSHGQKVRAVDIAAYLGYSKPSVSHMLKELSALGYVEVIDRDVRLTLNGKACAHTVYAKNQALYTLLLKLGVSRETAKIDACQMEHLLSDETFAAVVSACQELKYDCPQPPVFPCIKCGDGVTWEQLKRSDHYDVT